MTPTTDSYTLSLHDALPISLNAICHVSAAFSRQLFDGPFFLAELSKTFSYVVMLAGEELARKGDRKSTRLNSSHPSISYAVFCLKKKTNRTTTKNKYKNNNK